MNYLLFISDPDLGDQGPVSQNYRSIANSPS